LCYAARVSRVPRGRDRRLLWLLLATLLALVLPAHAAGPVVHTYFDPDPDEDLSLSATTPDGRLPAAIDTPSGVVPAPDTMKSPSESGPAYGGSSTPGSVDATYRIDRNTSRPDMVGYDDPFIPAITPFKRLYAYDVVEPSLELGVRDKSLTPISVGGGVRTGDDQFYGDMTVDLAQDSPVRIPSVGPGARVLAAYTSPATTFKLLRDGADNWFIRGSERKRVRLVMQLAIARDVFGSPFSSSVSWAALSQHVPRLPPAVKPAADRVAQKIGASQEMTPAAAVAALVGYFRSFAPSDDRPTSNGGAPLYEELALSKKGVCRHRAYAFLITAQAVGLPARMIRNEAHAWVELYDGYLWHRVDLGGAADRLDTEQDPSQPVHSPPADPFDWPQGSESGQELLQRTLTSQPGSGQGSSGSGAADAGAGEGGAQLRPAPGVGPTLVDAGASANEDDSRPSAHVEARLGSAQVRRGEPISVAGRVDADGDGCRGVRVDFALRSESGRLVPIQSLSAGDDGRFDGAIVVPPNLEVGEYDLVVSTPGDARCGSGISE